MDVEHPSEGKVRVFTERDVHAIVAAYEARTRERTVFTDQLQLAIDRHRGEPGEALARSAVDRLVALALTWGAWDYEGVPQATWDELFARGLLRQVGDQSGEMWPVLTRDGEAFFRAAIERDRS